MIETKLGIPSGARKRSGLGPVFQVWSYISIRDAAKSVLLPKTREIEGELAEVEVDSIEVSRPSFRPPLPIENPSRRYGQSTSWGVGALHEKR